MKKMHPWALGISAFIVLFLIVTITVVILVSQQDYHLVTKDYYEKDLSYQNEIDAKRRAADAGSRPVVSVDRAAKTCVLQFPEGKDYSGITGTATLFRISDARQDHSTPIALNSEGMQHISVSSFPAGQWILKLRWKEGGKEYSLDERVYLSE